MLDRNERITSIVRHFSRAPWVLGDRGPTCVVHDTEREVWVGR